MSSSPSAREEGLGLVDLAKTLRRQWKLVVPIGAIALGAALVVHTTTPGEYEARGHLLLQQLDLRSEESRASALIDPVALSADLEPTGDAEFSVSQLTRQSFTITAAAGTGQAAEAAVEDLIVGLQDQIDAIQDERGTPADERAELQLAVPEVLVEEQVNGNYFATAKMYLHDPTPGTLNPYGPDSATGRLLDLAVSGDAGRVQFATLAGEDVTFEVLQDPGASAVLEVVTSGRDPQDTIAAFSYVHTLMAEELEARQGQAGVVEDEQLELGVVAAPLVATDVGLPISRPTIGVLALGALLAVGLAIGGEGWARFRGTGPQEPGPEAAAVAPVRTGLAASGRTSGAEEGVRSGASTAASAQDVGDQDAGSDVPLFPMSPSTGRRFMAAPTARHELVRVPSPSGELVAHLALPEALPAPAVLVIQDWWGVDRHVLDVTERLAGAGLVALAPDLFGGATVDDLGQVDRFFKLLAAEYAMPALVRALAFLERHSAVEPGPVGVIGFGMGGGLALELGALKPNSIGAVVPYYAVGEYEAADLTSLSASVLGHFGERDDVVTPASARRLELQLEASNSPDVSIRVHEDARHGFADEADHLGTHDSELSLATWQESVAFIRATLMRARSMAE